MQFQEAITKPDTSHRQDTSNKISFYEKNFREINLNEHIGTKTLAEFLKDQKIPQIFKDIFQKKVALNDNDNTLSLIDSLFSNDSERHPFYFVLATRCLWWADGGFAEPFYMGIKRYVESRPKQFVEYFKNEKVLTQADFNNWADGVIMEIGISHEGQENEEIERLKERMKENCSDCPPDYLATIDIFVDTIKEYGP